MKSLCVALLAVACLAGSQNRCLAEEVSKPNPRENLDTAIAEAIRLIEAKEYETLITSFLPPEELSMLTSQVPMSQILEVYQARVNDHLKALKEAQKLKPEMNEEGNVATFTLKKPIKGNSKVVFRKIDKLWYAANASN